MRTNKAYLEQMNGEWFDDFVYVSRQPLIDLGFEIIPFDGDDLENELLCYPMDISKDVIIGSVGATNAFFKACDIEPPTYLGYPMEISSFLGRDIFKTTVGELTDENYPCFIKPSEGIKLFTGEVIESYKQIDWLKKYYDVTDDVPILVSGLVDFVSEYRCFVHEEELKGIQYYDGDFRVFPDVAVIEEIISGYYSGNVAYTLDVGITSDGRTLLVEVNDMWAIGSYGMDAKTYALMCVRRMREIGRQANGETEALWKRLKERNI